MLPDYIRAAMRTARYEILPEDGSFFGTLPGFQGVWANAETLEGCRDELEEVLEEWMVFRLSDGLKLPVLDGIDLNFREREKWCNAPPRTAQARRSHPFSPAKWFTGPFLGRKHRIMRRGDVTIRVPNPHQSDISVDLLARLLRQAGISRDEWEQR